MKEIKTFKKKEDLFNKFSSNFNYVCKAMKIEVEADNVELTDEKYTCPLSGLIYGRKHLSMYSNMECELTLEHAPQKSLGGNIVCLTMKKFNNSLTVLDSKLKERHDFEEAYANGILKFRTKIDNKYNVQSEISVDGKRVTLNLDKMPEVGKQKFLNSFGILNFNATFSYIREDAKSVVLGHIKNAYLLAFAQLGYGFIFGLNYVQHPLIDDIRMQIINPNQDLLPLNLVFTSNNLEDHMLGIGICRIGDYRWLQVCFDIGKSYKSRIAVLFPTALDETFDFIKAIQPNADYDFTMLGFPDISTKEGSLYYWNACMKLK